MSDGVTSIGKSAFFDCKNLTSVYYGGSKKDWEEISIGKNNSPLLSAEIVYADNSDDEAETDVELTGAVSVNDSIKFISKVNIEDGSDISAFGTTFIPLWLFSTGSSDVATVEYDNAQYNIGNGQTYGATLTDIPAEFADTYIVGKSYIKDSNGRYIWSDAKMTTLNNKELIDVE